MIYYIGGYVIYVILMIPVLQALLLLPSVDMGSFSEYFNYIYDRPNFATHYFSFSKVGIWFVSLIVGFTFVVVVNLNYERSNPFRSRDGSYKDIKTLMVWGAVLYFIAPIIYIRSEYDAIDLPTSTSLQAVENQDAVSIINAYLSNMLGWGNEDGKVYTYDEQFSFNYWYIIFYFIGLNFTHADKGPF